MPVSYGNSAKTLGPTKADSRKMVELPSESPKLSEHTRSHVETLGWEDGAPPKNTEQTIPHRDGSEGGFLAQWEKVGNVPRGTIEGFMKRADKISGGKADDKKPTDFDKKQLAKGMKVEMEHTNDKTLAKEISMDHLEEFPNYYTALDKMEARLKKQAGKMEKVVTSYLEKDKTPTDDEFHANSEKAGVNNHKAEETAYKMLQDKLKKEAAKKSRCWKGYEPVPGKKPYSEDSCRKKTASIMEGFMKRADSFRETKPLYSPRPSTREGKKYMVYVKGQGEGKKLIHFGADGYKHNYSEGAKKNFRSRHGCDKPGVSKDSAKWWACNYLWHQKQDIGNKTYDKVASVLGLL